MKFTKKQIAKAAELHDKWQHTPIEKLESLQRKTAMCAVYGVLRSRIDNESIIETKLDKGEQEAMRVLAGEISTYIEVRKAGLLAPKVKH